ncbi:PIR Superfamily Protein [Plasmodium ovale curtisi]|uniref:PIR Superfamily Protein n=1 Tax=Plasmodium ovale curtisi TaxID=864141 RepID=A0A1A8VKT6_PLAOA|nr:PIR Superfamily Protein [Plasmodium ovale curtisi]SBT02071.1 PIR Superfamily Protein [Plasmodium ovale curtisi]
MVAPESNNCELPSEKHYRELDNVATPGKFQNICDSNENIRSDENILNKYPSLKTFCYKLASNLEKLKEDKEIINIKEKHCIYLKHWLNHNVINTAEIKYPILYIMLLYAIWTNIIEKLKISKIANCEIKHSSINLDYRTKWKKMHDFNDDYKEMKCVFQKKEACREVVEEDCKEICKAYCKEVCKEDCKVKYCKYFVDIYNIYNEFQQVCNPRTENKGCPDFWKDFENNYLATSHIEEICKEVYEQLGFYKVKMSLGNEGEEKYVDQYESTYMFSFFEKLIGYSIKNILSKSLYYTKYILSLFGSKISPRMDDLRKMWRNVQGVTNPATLLHPPKPPLGGNKMGLPYMPR